VEGTNTALNSKTVGVHGDTEDKGKGMFGLAGYPAHGPHGPLTVSPDLSPILYTVVFLGKTSSGPSGP
jgi:hypothetical protein